MISQAMNRLRMAFESAVFGSLFCTNSFYVCKNTENPIVMLVEKKDSGTFVQEIARLCTVKSVL